MKEGLHRPCALWVRIADITGADQGQKFTPPPQSPQPRHTTTAPTSRRPTSAYRHHALSPAERRTRTALRTTSALDLQKNSPPTTALAATAAHHVDHSGQGELITPGLGLSGLTVGAWNRSRRLRPKYVIPTARHRRYLIRKVLTSNTDGPNPEEQGDVVPSGPAQGQVGQTEEGATDAHGWRRWWRSRLRRGEDRCGQYRLHWLPFRRQEYTDEQADGPAL